MVPRALANIFNLINSTKHTDNEITLDISFIEIYNEKVYDLLIDNSEQIKSFKFIGGTKRQVNCLAEAQQILNEGNKNRHVRPTKMNTNSSRSHAIFTVHLCVRRSNSYTLSAMHLVDLAGSEGVRRTGHQGAALAEGVHINQGLLSIGKVLQALSSGKKVIPYRDSVLSSVLQGKVSNITLNAFSFNNSFYASHLDSLNLNSYLTLLACVSPLKDDVSETLSTLRFAQSAKLLRNTPQINAILADYKVLDYYIVIYCLF